jgi:iron complex transport system substrate-binding protein
MQLKKFFIFTYLLLFAVSCSNNKQEQKNNYTITDDLGNSFTFPVPPKKIITLAPNLTEMIYDLGLGRHLVGNTTFCDYPPEAKSVTKIGDMLTFNLETIVSLKPDLVFITVAGNTKETYDKFRELGIKIFVSNPTSFNGIKKTYLDLGKIFGIEETAKKRIDEWNSVVDSISSASKEFPLQSAMFLVDLKPAMLAGKSTFLHQYLNFCGLKNIAEDSPMNYPMFSREDILKRNPDFIIYMAGKHETVTTIKEAYPEWAQLKAVKENKIILVDRDLYPRPGPRFIVALKDLSSLLLRGRKARQHLQ